jgi:hypothetical protein
VGVQNFDKPKNSLAVEPFEICPFREIAQPGFSCRFPLVWEFAGLLSNPKLKRHTVIKFKLFILNDIFHFLDLTILRSYFMP